VGNILEIEDGEEGRTIFLAPAGAGIELTMPDGDGFVTVVAPMSPLGKTILGCRLGDTVEVVVKGEPREWTVTFVA
jgi:transcription elongation GreA/GreB family factor